jgi:hypothetical protein
MRVHGVHLLEVWYHFPDSQSLEGLRVGKHHFDNLLDCRCFGGSLRELLWVFGQLTEVMKKTFRALHCPAWCYRLDDRFQIFA